MEIEEVVKEIKRSFRQVMDGAVAQSMRDKGVDYHLSWGVTLPRLHEMADDIKTTVPASSLYELAIALWKENIRECKILATMLMPHDIILPEVVDIWMEQTETVEIAEQAAMNLYQHLPYAPMKAYEWIASDKDLNQICGYHILSRLFLKGQEPNERGICEFLDQAHAALQSSNLIVRKAALNSLNHFSNLGLVYERLAGSVMRLV